MNARTWFSNLLLPAGITPNGPKLYDPQIHNSKLYSRVRWQGTLGLGEAYVDGWWDCQQIDQLFYQALSFGLEDRFALSLPLLLGAVRARLTNQQTIKRAFDVGEAHYDLGNDLFEAMLGPSMAYSCGYWKDADNLNDAQLAKYELICRKLSLEKGMTVLDIGCGWGGLAQYMATRYGVKVIGLTVSRKQVEYAQRHYCDPAIDIRFQDYRSFNQRVDRVVSIGMWEHIGPKNYRTAMQVVRRSLPDDGLFLLHTIGNPRSVMAIDPWVSKYIFPGGMLPSLKWLAQSAEGLFIIEDLHNFGAYYDPTLMAWYDNFDKAWPNLKRRYDERFHRMWRLYLLSCAGGFRARSIELWQLVLSPKGVIGGYQSIR